MFPLRLFFLSANFFLVPLTLKLWGLCCLQKCSVHGDDAENEKTKQKNRTWENVFPKNISNTWFRFLMRILSIHAEQFSIRFHTVNPSWWSMSVWWWWWWYSYRLLKRHIDQRLTVLNIKRTKKAYLRFTRRKSPKKQQQKKIVQIIS